MAAPLFDDRTRAAYYADGSWDARTLAEHVSELSRSSPSRWAFRAPDASLTWRQYDEHSTRLAATLLAAGMRRGDLLGVLLTGGSLVHVAYLAAEKAGLVIVGIGPRAGEREIADMVGQTRTDWLLTRADHRGRPTADLVETLAEHDARTSHHLVVELTHAGITVDLDGRPLDVVPAGAAEEQVSGHRIGPDELFFLNSTSGTTGRSKCVMATMNNRKYFADLAVEAGGMTGEDVFCSVLPSPYGFGLWSAHFVPTVLGAATVLSEEFDPAATLRLIEQERATVLAAVTSQLVMMLNSPTFDQVDLSSLRVVFTGGERVPRERAEEFEARTGATILQFYGSNEAGPVSVTRLSDPIDARLATVGRPIPQQQVRLYSPDGSDVTATGGPGQVGSLGPGTSPGYFHDEAANAKLFRTDGWQLTGDLARLDDDGYLVLSGRTADLVIRGGQNISALEVEAEVGSHPRVAQVAVVGLPDPVLGERVCAVVVTHDGAPLTLDELRPHLASLGISKHHWPERVEHRTALPLSTGGKTDKQRLRRELQGGD